MEDIERANPTGEDVVRSAVARSWSTLLEHPAALIVGGVLVILLSALTLSVLMVPLYISYTRMVRRALAGEQASVGDLFEGFGETVVPGILTWILIGIAMTIGFLLLVIPGLLVVLFCAFVVPALAYGDADDPVEAIKLSYGLVRSHLAPVIAVLLLAALVSGLGTLVALGVLISMPLSTLLVTSAYESLRDTRLPPGA